LSHAQAVQVGYIERMAAENALNRFPHLGGTAPRNPKGLARHHARGAIEDRPDRHDIHRGDSNAHSLKPPDIHGGLDWQFQGDQVDFMPGRQVFKEIKGPPSVGFRGNDGRHE